MALTRKQQRFVEEYLVDLNAHQAAIRAGYSKKTARVIGVENLSKPAISAAIQHALDERSKRTEITADRVIKEIARNALLDPRKVFREDGSLIPIHELDEDTAAAIASMEIVVRQGESGEEPESVKKIRFWDKNKALEMLGKHFRLFIEKVEHSTEDGKPLINIYIPDNGRDRKN